MKDSRLARLREELTAAVKRRDTLDAKIRDLERRCNEAENTCIHGNSRIREVTPEQLAELMRSAKAGFPRLPSESDIPETQEAKE